MSDINSSSTSEDWSRDSIVTSGGAPGDRPAVDVAAALVGMAEVLIGGGVAWWVGGSGWTGVDWTEVEVAGVCGEADDESLAGAGGWASRCARALRRLAMYRFFCSGVFLIHLTWSSMWTTSVWTGLFRSGVLSRSFSAGGCSSITVSKNVDFPLPATPTVSTLVMTRLETPRFISSSYICLARRLPTGDRWMGGRGRERGVRG